jgi:hypothetical protein
MSRRAAEHERGSALVLVLLGLVTGGLLVGLLVASSTTGSRDAAGGVGVTGAWYAAHAGLWAAADSLRTGGPGNLRGDVDAGTLSPATGPDADGDGFVDFPALDVLLARGDGAFEVRTRAEGPGRHRIRALGAVGRLPRRLEAVFEERRIGPFRGAAFGATDVSLLGNEMSDSYDSDVQSWGSTPVTATIAGRDVRGTSGGVASDGDVTVQGNARVNGDAEAAGAVTVSGAGVVTGAIGVLTPPLAPPLPTWTVPGPGDPSVSNGLIGVPYGGSVTLNSGTTTLPPGKYVFSSVTLNGSARVDVDVSAGDVEIYLIQPGGTNLRVQTSARIQPTIPSKSSGGNIIVRNSGGLAVGASAMINVNVVAGNPVPGDPVKFQYFSELVSPPGPVYGVDVLGGGMVSGVLYAPKSTMRLGASMQMWGSAVTDTVYSSGSAFLHYDASLRNLSPGGLGELVFAPILVHELR